MSALVELNLALAEALGLRDDTKTLQAVTLRIRAGKLPTITAQHIIADHRRGADMAERVRTVIHKYRIQEVSAAAIHLKPARGEE